MPELETVSIPLHGIEVIDTSTGGAVDLGGLRGVSLLVLMRHRH